jgi:hypothetical protein
MDKNERCCGNCYYGDYYKRKCAVIKTSILCEVYTRRMETGHKPCHNWKERRG